MKIANAQMKMSLRSECDTFAVMTGAATDPSPRPFVSSASADLQHKRDKRAISTDSVEKDVRHLYRLFQIVEVGDYLGCSAYAHGTRLCMVLSIKC